MTIDQSRARKPETGANRMMNKTVADYMNLPYTIELQRDAEAGWFVRVQELPGCMSQGDTAEEALAMIQDAMSGWLEVAIEEGLSIPEPRPEEDYSGKFVVRVPKSLHRDLVLAADREGASLNQFINTILARAVGRAELAQQEGRLRELSDLMSRVERLLYELNHGSALGWEHIGGDLRFGRPTEQPAPVTRAIHEPLTPYTAGADEEAAP